MKQIQTRLGDRSFTVAENRNQRYQERQKNYHPRNRQNVESLTTAMVEEKPKKWQNNSAKSGRVGMYAIPQQGGHGGPR